MVSEEWLSALNKEFREGNIDPRRRPLEALIRYSKEFHCSMDLSSDTAKQIQKWFEENSKPGLHHVGAIHESAYFYDSQFWIVSVPLVFGEVQIEPISSLEDCPEKVKQEFLKNPSDLFDYAVFWADCFDYGFGMEDIQTTSNLNAYGLQLLKSANQELGIATLALTQNRPDSRAILHCRMAVEIFLKAFLALKTNATDKDLKKIGHDIDKALTEFIEVSGYKNWESARGQLKVFPDIQDRYKEQRLATSDLWLGYSLAHSLGATVVREFTKRNMLQQVLNYVNSQQKTNHQP